MSATKLASPLQKELTFLFDSKFVSKEKLVKKASKGKPRMIEGIANFKVIDRIGDLIDPTAYTKSLPTYMQNPQLRFNHEEGSSIGKVLKAEMRENGLWIQAEIGDWPLANEKWQQMEFGSLKALSVMGRVNEWVEKVDAKTGQTYYYITEFDLVEIAVVEIPMNQLSLFEVKSAERLTKNRDAYLEVHKKLKDNLLKNYEMRLKKVSEVLEDPEKKEDEIVEEEVEEETTTEEETIDEKSLKAKDGDEGETSTADALKSISEFVKNFVDESEVKFANLDERLKSLEAKGKMEDEDMEDDEDDEKSLTIGVFKKFLNDFGKEVDEKINSISEKKNKDETPNFSKSFRKTVSKSKADLDTEVKGLAAAIRERMDI
jgi:HK97 family phage prohead protease